MTDKNGYPMVVINNEFGKKNGSNFIHIRCFANENDARKFNGETHGVNALAGDSRHIGIGYLKEGQTLTVCHRIGQLYDNEGKGKTYSANVIMDAETFQRKFDAMCVALTEGLDVTFK